MPPVAPEAEEVAVRLVSPGGEAGPGVAVVAVRSDRWRRSGALRQLLWWALVPVVIWIPPHFPWVIVVLALGAVRAWGRWREHVTLLKLSGTCPHCQAEQTFPDHGRLRHPHEVHCVSCRWSLRVEPQG